MPKGIFKELAALKPQKLTPFIPFLYTYAAKLSQIPVDRMLTDPAAMAKSISMAYRLLNYDAIVVPFDSTLEAEALGCEARLNPDSQPSVISPAPNIPDDLPDSFTGQGRIPVIVDAVKRLQSELGREIDIAAGITGPLTLARKLGGEVFSEKAEEFLELAGKAAAALVRMYGEMDADGLVLVEESFTQEETGLKSLLQSQYKSIFNICEYYELPVMLYTREVSEKWIATLDDLDWGGIIMPGTEGLKITKERALKSGMCFGAPLALGGCPEYSAGEINNTLSKYIKDGGKKGFFICSDGDLPMSLPVEILHDIIASLKKGS